MISLDQIQLLQQKVEKAILKISELQNINDSLTLKCNELEEKNTFLTNKVATFEADQNKIEQGILKALERLNTVESSVLQSYSEPETQNYSSISTENTSIEEQTVGVVDNITESIKEVPLQNSYNNQSDEKNIQLVYTEQINDFDSFDNTTEEVLNVDSSTEYLDQNIDLQISNEEDVANLNINFDDISDQSTDEYNQNTSYVSPTPDKPYNIF